MSLLVNSTPDSIPVQSRFNPGSIPVQSRIRPYVRFEARPGGSSVRGTKAIRCKRENEKGQ
jgi:hypothetical protein